MTLPNSKERKLTVHMCPAVDRHKISTLESPSQLFIREQKGTFLENQLLNVSTWHSAFKCQGTHLQ